MAKKKTLVRRKKRNAKKAAAATAASASPHGAVDSAIEWLKETGVETTILIKQTRNLGDTLHITPVARHYKLKFPQCKIAFIVGDRYAPVHENNPDFDKIFTVHAKLNPQQRIELGTKIMRTQGITIKLCPSIHPFGSVWKSHVWSVPEISQQYFLNSEIKPGTMLGDRKLHAPIGPAEMEYANRFCQLHRGPFIGLEYYSYSRPPVWTVKNFTKLAALARRSGFKTISFAGHNEALVGGSIDSRGLSWRRTIAVLSKCKYMVGVGSGITMLAACATPTPKILEMQVGRGVSMVGCGYADSTLVNCGPPALMKIINEHRAGT